MPTEPSISNLAHLIELSIAPVFLLTGVAGLLGVMTNRLARIIDRRRVLDAKAEKMTADETAEVPVLRARALMISRAIRLCTFCALLVASIIATMFMGAFVRVDVSVAVAVAFVAAMLSLIGGLLSFLREVHLAIRRMSKFHPPHG